MCSRAGVRFHTRTPELAREAAAHIIRAGAARVRPPRLPCEGSPMACLCSLQLGSLLNSLPSIPSTAGLVPAIPLPVVVAMNGIGPPAVTAQPSASMAAAAAASAQAGLTANLAAMASFSTAAKAAMGVNLAAPLSASAHAGLQAALAANVQSLNASGPVLLAGLPGLAALIGALANLVRLLGVLAGARATFGIDVRAPGAIAALQAALDASAGASASGAAAATAAANASAVASLMATMGFAANAQGAASASAAATAMSRLTLGVPPITANFNALSLLSAVMGILTAIVTALGVDLRAPNALASLRIVLSTLPLTALAQLRVNAAGTTSARATAAATVKAQSAASAAAALDLSAVARANMTAAGQLAVLMRLTANANFLLVPPGACNQPCPLVVGRSRGA